MSGDDWFWLVFGTIGFAVAVADLQRRRSGGPVLLDLGGRTHPYDYAVTVVMMIAFLYTRMRFHADISFPLFGVLGLAACSILGATRRFQIRETGLLGRRNKLIRWEKIEAYEISPAGTLSLKIRNKGWTFFCDLSPERHPDVETVLKSRQQTGELPTDSK
jgi:hypothetical protein